MNIRNITNLIFIGIISKEKWWNWHLLLNNNFKVKWWRVNRWRKINLFVGNVEKFLILKIHLISMFSPKVITLMLLMNPKRKLSKKNLFLSKTLRNAFFVNNNLIPSQKTKIICKINMGSSFHKESIAKIWKHWYSISSKKYRLEICALIARTKEPKIFSQDKQFEGTW